MQDHPEHVEWRLVEEYPNYEVSSDGRVRNKKKGRSVAIINGNQGSCMVNLWKDGKRAFRQVHRLQAAAFLELPPGMTVNHINGIRTDNRLENLEVVTQAENNRHKVDVLGLGRGEGSGMAKLTDFAVQAIRSLRIKGYPQKALSDLFDVDCSVISKICARKIWRHV